MSTITKEVFKSRWGFHPVPYELYLKLKFIHKCYYQTLHDVGAYERWRRKRPENRVIRKWQRDDQGNKIGSEVVGPMPEPAVFWDLYLPRSSNELNKWVQDYQRARMPRTEEEVPTLNHTVDQINQMYYRCKEFFGE